MKILGFSCCALVALLVAGAAFVPLRHEARLESDASNPVQRIVLESRSLLGLRCTAWGARIEGASAWGNAREGFYASPASPCEVTLRAWPSLKRSFALQPIGRNEASRLRDEGEREAFRTWFVAILERQLEDPSPAWEPAQRDCAGLLRFAFREAWGPHTEAWRDRVGFGPNPVAGEPRVHEAGPWPRAFPTPEGWRPFAKGAFLRRLACVPLGRDLSDARPGDLIFFARSGARPQPDHAMALVRPDTDGMPVLLYHTGPEGSGATRIEGEVRRVRLDELMHHPDPEFRPVPENAAFLGVFRWIVLAGGDMRSHVAMDHSLAPLGSNSLLLEFPESDPSIGFAAVPLLRKEVRTRVGTHLERVRVDSSAFMNTARLCFGLTPSQLSVA